MTNSNDADDEKDEQRERARLRLGVAEPRCVDCGEDDPLCLELHHIAGKANDDVTGIYCRNCHRKQSNPANNAKVPTDPPVLERVGQFLAGLAEIFAALVDKCREFSAELLKGAQECQWPLGWVGAPGAAA